MELSKKAKTVIIVVLVILIIICTVVSLIDTTPSDNSDDKYLSNYIDDLVEQKKVNDKESQNSKDYFDIVGLT